MYNLQTRETENIMVVKKKKRAPMKVGYKTIKLKHNQNAQLYKRNKKKKKDEKPSSA